jgi:hypothetical protein
MKIKNKTKKSSISSKKEPVRLYGISAMEIVNSVLETNEIFVGNLIFHEESSYRIASIVERGDEKCLNLVKDFCFPATYI